MAQKLLNKEIPTRLDIYLDRSIKNEDKGVNGLMTFGDLNDYPQKIEKWVNGSVTAKAVAGIYAKFLIGQGFEDDINDIKVGFDSRGKKVTLGSLLRQVAQSISINNGFYIHTNLSPIGSVGNVHLKPFKNCRFAKPDNTGYSAKILLYDNWVKEQGKNFKRYDKNDIVEYNVFNLDDKVLTEQIKNAKGIENYKGQIYFQFIDDTYFYPLSPFDSAYLEMDTEAQMSVFKNNQIRNGFQKKIVMRISPSGSEEEKEEFAEASKSFLGPDGKNFLLLEQDVDEDGNLENDKGALFNTVESNIDDKLFEGWEKSLFDNIRLAGNGVPEIFLKYDAGSLGTTSGETIIQATNYYNSFTNDVRTLISASFEEIFSNSENEILRNNTNWKIKPINLIEQEKDGVTNINPTTSN